MARYARRASGPLLDRIDLFVRVERTPLEQLGGPADAESTAAVRERVRAAREHQAARAAKLGLADADNARLPPGTLADACRLTEDVLRTARVLGERLHLSARAWHRMLRVARTCADLEHADAVDDGHVREALRFRDPEATARASVPRP